MAITDLAIPEKNTIPSYILNAAQAKVANEDALAGISTGGVPRIKLSGKDFILVDGSGNETSFPKTEMVVGPDNNFHLPLVVLRAKKNLSKSWYSRPFDPNASEPVSPDCWSDDAVKPDASVRSPQSPSCATCQLNAFGSGVDHRTGASTKGKACADNKIIAVAVSGKGIFSLKLPATSLKNWGVYVKKLSDSGIPLGVVRTLVSFDPLQTHPVLVFQFGGFLPEAALPVLEEKSKSAEVEDIIKGRADMAAALPAPAQGTEFSFTAQVAPATPAAQAAPAPAPVAQATPVPAPTQAASGFDFDMPAQPKAQVQQPPVQAKPSVASSSSDDDLLKALGI